jgi:hypothetical protein
LLCFNHYTLPRPLHSNYFSLPLHLFDSNRKVRDLRYTSVDSFFRDLSSLRLAIVRTTARTYAMPSKVTPNCPVSPLLEAYDTIVDCCRMYLSARSAALSVVQEECDKAAAAAAGSNKESLSKLDPRSAGSTPTPAPTPVPVPSNFLNDSNAAVSNIQSVTATQDQSQSVSASVGAKDRKRHLDAVSEEGGKRAKQPVRKVVTAAGQSKAADSSGGGAGSVSVSVNGRGREGDHSRPAGAGTGVGEEKEQSNGSKNAQPNSVDMDTTNTDNATASANDNSPAAFSDSCVELGSSVDSATGTGLPDPDANSTQSSARTEESLDLDSQEKTCGISTDRELIPLRRNSDPVCALVPSDPAGMFTTCTYCLPCRGKMFSLFQW